MSSSSWPRRLIWWAISACALLIVAVASLPPSSRFRAGYSSLFLGFLVWPDLLGEQLVRTLRTWAIAIGGRAGPERVRGGAQLVDARSGSLDAQPGSAVVSAASRRQAGSVPPRPGAVRAAH